VPVLEGWRYCPRCRAELDGDLNRLACPGCGLVVYANSVPAACALCEDEQGRVLLTRRAHEPYQGMWDLPGGFLEETEHPLDALRRELREETGLEVDPTEWFGAFLVPYDGRMVLNLVWRARVVGGEPSPADDVSELGWFAADELPARTAMDEPLRLWQQQAQR
jgi:ADP-ribose pyrophosphatase YjhB (NUDIX family)